MVKSNQVASHPADTRLVSQSSNASALNSDATPLLRQGSGPLLRRQKSLPKSKQKAAKKRSADEEAAEDQRAASKASLQLVLENWEAPSDKAAKLAHVKTHYHHELFSLSDTKTEDLAEFGQGLALYFYFLKWIAMLLAAMSVVVLPNMVWSGIARKGGTSTTGTELYDLHGGILLCKQHDQLCTSSQAYSSGHTYSLTMYRPTSILQLWTSARGTLMTCSTACNCCRL